MSARHKVRQGGQVGASNRVRMFMKKIKNNILRASVVVMES